MKKELGPKRFFLWFLLLALGIGALVWAFLDNAQEISVLSQDNVIATEAHAEAEEAETEPLVKIEVREGQTLWGIAKGVGMDLQELMEVNGLHSNRIYPGQILEVRPYTLFDNVLVSWYGPGFQGNTMANGEVFDMDEADICAHKWLPFGTRIRLTRVDTGESIVVTVKDRGPYKEGRHIDLSQAAAEALNMINAGVVECWIEILPISIGKFTKTSLFFMTDKPARELFFVLCSLYYVLFALDRIARFIVG